jgi:hypothetical protein
MPFLFLPLAAHKVVAGLAAARLNGMVAESELNAVGA